MDFRTLISRLEEAVGRDAVLSAPEDVMLYEYDAGLAKGTPSIVVLPRTAEHVQAIVRLSNEAGISVTPRGAGTGLSGGAISCGAGIVIAFARMNRILAVDGDAQRAVVQPGVVNLDLSAAVAHHGLYFAPDPASQKAATVGGHVAENSGGPHTLLHGVTVNHVTGLEMVLADGRLVQFGGASTDSPGYDLTGFFTGSEGTLGIATAITVKLKRLPEKVATMLAIYDSMDDAAHTVVAITAEGVTPAALEMLDGRTLRTVEEQVHAGYPLEAGAVLLIEVEGLREEVEEQVAAVGDVCTRHHAREVRVAATEQERQLLWKGRRTAFGAIGKLAPAYYSQDVVVPRTKIPATLRRIDEIAAAHGRPIFNIFHAGDGNMHPAILFDPRDPGQVQHTHAAAREIIRYCCEVGGSITGEHGVGMEKNEMMPFLFSADDLAVMQRLRDVFNPRGLLNPAKLFPVRSGCREGVVASVTPAVKAEEVPR